VKETTERWIVLWFPPEGDKQKTFTDEGSARRFAAREDDYEVTGIAQHAPLLLHRIVVTETTEMVVPL
jgi:hypothetical protein